MTDTRPMNLLNRNKVSRRGVMTTIVAGALLASVGCASLTPPTPGNPAAGAAISAAPNSGTTARNASEQTMNQISPEPGTIVATSGIVVTGEGEVRASPDIAYLTTGVESRGPTAREAQNANTAAMTAVLDALKGLGIAETDIQTSGVHLSPVFDRDPSNVTGYVATNSVTVTIQDVSRAGEILDAAISAGANVAGNIQFGLKDDSQLRQQAVTEAVKSARVRADSIAAAAGLQIVGIRSMVDQSGSTGPRGPEMVRSMAADAAASVPIQPGQLVVVGRVQVTYAFQ